MCLGFRNMLLSSDFDIANPLFTRQIYQDMTRYVDGTGMACLILLFQTFIGLLH